MTECKRHEDRMELMIFGASTKFAKSYKYHPDAYFQLWDWMYIVTLP